MEDDKKWQGRRVNKEIEEYMIKVGAKVFTDEGGKRDGPRIIWLYVLFFKSIIYNNIILYKVTQRSAYPFLSISITNLREFLISRRILVGPINRNVNFLSHTFKKLC